ncbi:MAG: hypothetical protein ORN85_09225, partial [Sediminibacterium sp.]|nr:hypothetical protein [Sediminibacterium sp.]
TGAVASGDSVSFSTTNTSTYAPRTDTVSRFFYYAVVRNTSAPEGCNVATSGISGAIDVFAAPTISVQPTTTKQYLCQNQISALPTISVVGTSGGNGNLNYQWYSNVTKSNSGGTLIAGATTANITPSVSNFGLRFYYVVLTNNGPLACNSLNSNTTDSIQVYDTPRITTINLSAAQYCRASANPSINALSINVSSNYGNYITRWFRAPINPGGSTSLQTTSAFQTGSNNINFSTNLNSTAGSFQYYAVVTNQSAPNSCGVVTSDNSGLIEVFVRPTITSLATDAPQSVCIRANSITPLTGSASSTYGTLTYRWYYNTTNAKIGQILIPNSNALTYMPPDTVVGSFYYWFVADNGGPEACDTVISNNVPPFTINNFAGALVVVNPAPIITSNNLNSGGLYCFRASIPQFIITANDGSGNTNVNYRWSYSKTPGGFTDTLEDATVNSFTPFNDSLGTSYYQVEVINANCTTRLQSSAINVFQLPNITTQPSTTNYNYCRNGGEALNQLSVLGTDANNGTNVGYSWYRISTNQNFGGTLVANNASSYTPSDTAGGVYYYYAIISNNLGANTCSITSQPSGAYNIYVQPSINSSSLNGNSYCISIFGSTGNPLSVNASANIGTPQITWYRNNVSNTNNARIIGNGSNYNPRIDTPGTFYYFAIVSNTNSPAFCKNTTSAISGAILVYQPPILTNPSKTRRNYCANQSTGLISLSVTATNNGPGAVSYQWYSNESASNIGGQLISGAISNTYTPSTTVSGARYYYVVAKLVGSPNCDSVISDTSGLITIIPLPQIIAQSGFVPSQSYCLGGSLPQLSVTANDGLGGNAITYSWYTSKIAGQQGQLIAGQNTNLYTPSGDSVGTNYYQVLIQNNFCQTSLQTGAYTVNRPPTILSQPNISNFSNCLNFGGLSDITINARDVNNGFNLQYQWFKTRIQNNQNGILISQISSITPLDDSIGTFYYFVVVSNNVVGNSCNITSNLSGAYSIYPTPTLTQNTPSATYCRASTGSRGTNLSVTPTLGIGNGRVVWYRTNNTSPSNGDSVGFTLGNGISNYAPRIDTAARFYFYAVVTNLSAPTECNTVTSAISGVINIYAAPIITTQLNKTTQNYCLNQSGVSALTIVGNAGGNGNLTYQWYSNTLNSNIGGTIISGQTGQTFTPPVSSQGKTYYYVVLKNGGISGCDSTISDTSGAINVYLFPRIVSSNLSSGGNYCNGVAIPAFTVNADNGVSGQTTGINYQWYYSRNSGGVNNMLINSANSNNFTPYTDSIGISYYTITISNGYCSTSANSAALTVNRLPSIVTQIGKTAFNYCINGGTQTPLSISATDATGGAALSYQWYRNNIDAAVGGTLLSSNSNTTNPTDTSIGQFYYYVVIANAL